MKIYLAGPMTGIPQFNYPAFRAGGELLTQLGHDVFNPAELDDEATQAQALRSKRGRASRLKETWGSLLSRDVRIVSDEVDAVALLPNWFTSRGARLEAFVALQLQKPLFFLTPHGSIVPVPPEVAMKAIAENTLYQGDVSHYEE